MTSEKIPSTAERAGQSCPSLPTQTTVEQGDREPTGYCRPGGHVWIIQPGRTYQTCFWCDVIRT